MLALSPPLFSTFGWPLEDPIMSNEQKNWMGIDPFVTNNYRETETSESFLHHFPSSQQEIELDEPRVSSTISGDPVIVKKLTHNASERDRRKKLNSLYSTLRSLLPSTDHTKKLSIPVTVSHVLKYIPELQKQIERLTQRKEELLSNIPRQRDCTQLTNQRKVATKSSLPIVSASRIDDREVVVQICTCNIKRSPLSEVLLNLEEEGLQVMDASAFASNGERVFYNLHLQVKETQSRKMECEVLIEKLLSLYEIRESLCP